MCIWIIAFTHIIFMYMQEKSLLEKERDDTEIALKRLKNLDDFDDENEV
jgi:hypothetical protein